MADLIDRGKLLEYIDDNFYPTTVSCYMTVAEARVARERHNKFIDAINNAPAVDAVPVRRGHWEKITGMAPPEFHGHYACSICGWSDKRLTTLRREMDYNFCPNCGANMREGENDG